jgi:hypothetical protein
LTSTPSRAQSSFFLAAGISFAFWGRSRTWPKLASTTNSFPKNRLIVFAFDGDSTITSFFPLEVDIRVALRSSL